MAVPRRNGIALAAVLVALVSSRVADAQVIAPHPAHVPGSPYQVVVTGAGYDMLNQDLAEHRLQKLLGKAESGAATEHDIRKIRELQHRIAVDCWLIRYNLFQEAGPYPHALRLDPPTCEAIAMVARPSMDPGVFRPGSSPMSISSTPTTPITIVNATPMNVAFAVDGVAHRAIGGLRQDLKVSPDSQITYDAGGATGERRHALTPGVYEFRTTAEGRALFKLAGATP